MKLSREDEATVRAAMAGDQVAFETLVNTFARLVYAQSFSILHNRQDAEDVTQDTFLKAYRYRVKLDDPSRFPQWLLAIARNAARDRLRKHYPGNDPGNKAQTLADDRRHASPLTCAELNDDVGQLRQALDCLPLHYREALRLRYIEGLDHRTMRQRMSVSEGALRGILGRALRRMRALMGVS